MPTLKLTLKLPSCNKKSLWVAALFFSLLLLLSIWFVWSSWLFLILLLLLVVNFIILACKQENKTKVVIGFLLVTLAGTGLVFSKNFKIEKKSSDKTERQISKQTLPEETQKTTKKPSPTPTPTSKYEVPLKIAKECVLGAPPCNQQLFDWQRLQQIVVEEQTIEWDPVENNEFWRIMAPPPEIEARLTKKKVWRVYFEVPPKPPEGRIQNPDESVKITINQETKEVISFEQGWDAAHAAPNQGEVIPRPQWP